MAFLILFTQERNKNNGRRKEYKRCNTYGFAD